MSSKILVIDDEEHIVELLQFNLETSDYIVDYSYDGFDGFLKAKENKPDLILLDWMLPNISGIDVLKKLRGDKDLKNIPVIMLTAKNMESDKVEGLVGGADDYITKPFSIKELLARISSVLRRYNMNSPREEEVLTVKDIKLDLIKHEVTKNGEKLDLTLKEFDLLKILLQNKGKVLSRNFLLDKIWGYEFYGETRTVDRYVQRIREKLDLKNSIKTIFKVGYRLEK